MHKGRVFEAESESTTLNIHINIQNDTQNGTIKAETPSFSNQFSNATSLPSVAMLDIKRQR